MRYLITEVQFHKTGNIVVNNTTKANWNGTDGALRVFYEALNKASFSQSQMKCKVEIKDENLVRLKYDEVVNENVKPDEPTPETPSEEPTE